MNMAEILFVKCGAIGWLLWVLSVVTVAMTVQYFVSIRRSTILPDAVKAQIQALFDERQYREAIELTASEPSFLSHTINAALGEAAHGFQAMERAMEEAAEERTSKLYRQVEWLNLMGNISPMLGLMGTVWGMILAFFEIVAGGGTANPAQLADSIGVALVTTLLGLAVAIPAMSVYGIMRNRIDGLSADVVIAAEDLLGAFRPGGARKQAANGEKDKTPPPPAAEKAGEPA